MSLPALQILIPGEKDDRKRLDKFLQENLPDLSRSQIQRMVEAQEILVSGNPSKASYRIRGTEQIQICQQPKTSTDLEPEPIPLEILFEDEDLAVVNKPAGLVVHSGAGVRSGTLVNALLHHFKKLSSSGPERRPGIVHRLDKQTSGLMLVAKTDAAHLRLSMQFQAREVTKKYLALVHGRMERKTGEITAAIGRDRVNRVKMTVRAAKARQAYTLFRVLEQFERFTLVQLEIKTGRTHQIRVHLSSIHHPVVGDTLYGAPARIVLPGQSHLVATLARNFLHAGWLEFAHPRTLESMKFQAPLPEELSLFLQQLRNSQALHQEG
jgi:23S rRNA pseudouridine1911/1915/1917 synthase